MGMGGERRAPTALLPGKTRYPLYRRLFMNSVEPSVRNPLGLSSLWTDYEHGLRSKDAGVIVFRAKRPKSDPVYESTAIFRNVGVTITITLLSN